MKFGSCVMYLLCSNVIFCLRQIFVSVTEKVLYVLSSEIYFFLVYCTFY